MKTLPILAVVGLAVASQQPPAPLVDFSPLGVVEASLTSGRDHDNPFQDVTVSVDATAPSGRRYRGEAFWDGGRTWRIRLPGDESGVWTWTTSSVPADPGLTTSGRTRHGNARPPSRLAASSDGSHLVDDRGRPFFWLADTAWNGALRSTGADWREYLTRRASQRFTAIQFVTTQWRGGTRVIPRPVYHGSDRIAIDPDAFASLDAKFAAVVRHGLRPAPVMLWALNPTDPGLALSEADAVRLARYEIARWGALRPVWFLGGDGRYLADTAPDRWKRIGRAVFGDAADQLATLHPSGLNWIADAFAGETWLDFIGYQSGHGDGERDLRWLVMGPPASSAAVAKPVINLEPNYEGHPAYQSKTAHSPANVRRAAYWSMLVHAPAGVSYGNNEIWVWNLETADAESHANLRQIRPWRAGLETEGIASMTQLRRFFESGPWTALRPAPQLLAEQPGEQDPRRFVAVAQTASREWTVAYLPMGGTLRFRAAPARRTTWVNPRTGERRAARGADGTTFAAPTSDDWVFEARR